MPYLPGQVAPLELDVAGVKLGVARTRRRQRAGDGTDYAGKTTFIEFAFLAAANQQYTLYG